MKVIVISYGLTVEAALVVNADQEEEVIERLIAANACREKADRVKIHSADPDNLETVLNFIEGK